MHNDYGQYRPPRWKVALTVWCLLAYAGLCWLGQEMTERPLPATALAEPTDSAPPETWATDGLGESDAGVISRGMPAKPFKGQKTECGEDEVKIVGGCWMEVVRKPKTDACGTKAFLWEGKCFIPVMVAKAPPVSGDERPAGERPAIEEAPTPQ